MVWLLTFYHKFALHKSSPIYGWWYFVMLNECYGKTLGQMLLKFPPTNDDEVDTLMGTNIRI